MRIIPAHKKYRRKKAGIAPWHSDLRYEKSILSRPIIGHTPRKLPRFASNLPHHRSAARVPGHGTSNASLIIIQDTMRFVKCFFGIFSEISQKSL